MTTTDTLIELWQLSEEGEAAWWPGEVQPQDGEWTYHDQHDCIYCIYEHHALDLVTAEAERWLGKKGWNMYRSNKVTTYVAPTTLWYLFLTKALKYAMNNESGVEDEK